MVRDRDTVTIHNLSSKFVTRSTLSVLDTLVTKFGPLFLY